MASCTSAPWAILRHALHGTVGADSSLLLCVMRLSGLGGTEGTGGVGLGFPSPPLPEASPLACHGLVHVSA